MSISMMVAMTKNRVIGEAGALPWHMAEELARFKKITVGQTVIMGLKTYQSIGRPLPDRHNIVLDFAGKQILGVEVCQTIDDAVELAESYGREIYVIGGASIYEQMLPMVDTLHISHLKKDYGGSVYFPEMAMDDWQERNREEYDEFTAVTYERIYEKQPVSA